MHILLLTQVLPYPLDAGPKTRAYYVLRALAEEHEVTLISFTRSTDTQAAIDHLRTICGAVISVPIRRSKAADARFLAGSLSTPTPFVIARDHSPAMEQAISDATLRHGPFDAVHSDQLWMAPYARFAYACAPFGRKPHLVLDQHNATWRIFDRLAQTERNPLTRALYGLESRKLARFELETCNSFDAVVWVTQDDVAEMQAISQEVKVHASAVIPICIDAKQEPPISRVEIPKRITFVGGLHYPPNAQGVLWFVRNVMPLILPRVPDAVLTVVGKQPPSELAQAGIPPENLDITGYVNDVQPWLTETAAFIVPLLAGGGMRVKILDGWRWGLPIVSTRVGAEGIVYDEQDNILIADDPTAFANAVVHLLQHPQDAQRLADAGRAWVEDHYHWHTVYRQWLSLYARLGARDGGA
jgi:glycosyltransferase involved in cell wall biosynthesis